MTDPRLNRILAREAREAADKAEFDTLLKEGLSQPADDQAKLQQLLGDGVLTPAEYFAQLQRISDSQ